MLKLKLSSLIGAAVAISLTSANVYADEVTATAGASNVAVGHSFSSGFSVLDNEFETTVQKALERGYGKELGEVFSNENAEFRVDGIVVDQNVFYADISVKLPKQYDADELIRNIPATPAFRISTESEPEQWHEQRFTSWVSSRTRHVPNSEPWQSMELSAELEPGDEYIYLILDSMTISSSEEHRYSVAEWLENPVEGIEMQNIEFSENEMFIFYELADFNASIDVLDSELSQNVIFSGSQGSGGGAEDEPRWSYAHFTFEDYEASIDTVLSLTIHNREELEIGLSAQLSLEGASMPAPFYDKEPGLIVPSINGDIQITNITISHLFSSISLESIRSDTPPSLSSFKSDALEIAANAVAKSAISAAWIIADEPGTIYTTTGESMVIQPAVEPYIAPAVQFTVPRTLADYRLKQEQDQARHYASQWNAAEPGMLSREILRVEINGEQSHPISGSGSYSGDWMSQTNRYRGVESLSDIKIFILQEDSTYKEIILP